MSNNDFCMSALCLMVLLVPGCHGRSRTEAGAGPKPLPEPSQTTKSHDLINSGLFDNNPKALKAWLKFIEDGKYRAAHADDFKFSEAAKSELRSMFGDEWYPRINHPAITGNINRRLEFHDLAVIVVDTRRNDRARFGLVIFNIDPNKEQAASVHWLFQSRDLSSSLLSWHSNWPVLVSYAEDGTPDPYYINWNEKTKQYFLNKEQIGPGARPARLREKAKPERSTDTQSGADNALREGVHRLEYAFSKRCRTEAPSSLRGSNWGQACDSAIPGGIKLGSGLRFCDSRSLQTLSHRGANHFPTSIKTTARLITLTDA